MKTTEGAVGELSRNDCYTDFIINSIYYVIYLNWFKIINNFIINVIIYLPCKHNFNLSTLLKNK